MPTDDEFFTPENVDEQIDSFKHGPGHLTDAALPTKRIVSHLRQYYQQNIQKQPDPLEQAWERIVAGQQTMRQTARRKSFMFQKQQSQPSTSAFPMKRKLTRRISLVAAILFVGLLIGSMAFVLSVQKSSNQSKQTNTASGGTPLPTPSHPIIGGACTISTTTTYPRQSTSSQPGLYIFAENEQSDNLLYRYNPKTKQVIWSIKLCSTLNNDGILEQNGILYLAVTDYPPQATSSGAVSYLYALNETNGSVIWGVQFPTQLYMVPTTVPTHTSLSANLGPIEAPTIANGNIYVVQRTGVVYAFNALTGSQIWKFVSGRNAWATTSQGNGSIVDPSSVQVVNGIAYFSIVDRLYALDAQSGQRLWSQTFNNTLDINQAPAIDGGTVYITAFVPGYGSVEHPDTYIYAFHAQTGTQKWKSTKLSGYLNAPIATNGKIAVASYAGTWYNLNPASGSLETQRTLNSGGPGYPVLINHELYGLSSDSANNTLSVLNTDGTTKWSAPVSGVYPFINDVQGGVIYVSGRGNGVYAYSATDGHFLWHYAGYKPQPEGIMSVTIVP